MPANPLIIVTLTLLGLFGCGCDKDTATQVRRLPSATALPAPVLVASEKPIILLYADGLGGVERDSPTQPLEVAVWGDGRIVWRQDNALLEGRTETKRIDELLQQLHREGVFGSGSVEYVNYGPDSAFDVVEVRLPDRTLKLESWHEGFEQNPKLVDTSKGVTALEGRSREAVLAAELPEYLRFRRIWSDIRTAVKSWTPADGKPFAGPDPLGRGG